MASKKTPEEYLESLKSTSTEANRLKSSVLQYEKTASKHTNTIAAWVTQSKDRIDTTVVELRARLVKEAAAFRKAAKVEEDAVEAIRKETKDKYNRFNQTYNAADSKRTGVAVKHAKILKLADEAAKNANEISKAHTKANNDKDSISELLKTSRKNDKEISDIHAEADRVNQEIQNTYGITLDTTLAGTLVDRRNALKKRTETWERLYIGSIAVIVIAIFIALLVDRPNNFLDVITERLVFVTPLAVIAFVLGRQFGHERKLYEEYAFKAAAAQSLRGYTVLLNSEFNDMEQARLDILAFTIGAMEGIYDREPLVQNPSTFHVMFGNDAAKFEAKMEEKIHKAADEAAKAVVEEVELAARTS